MQPKTRYSSEPQQTDTLYRWNNDEASITMTTNTLGNPSPIRCYIFGTHRFNLDSSIFLNNPLPAHLYVCIPLVLCLSILPGCIGQKLISSIVIWCVFVLMASTLCIDGMIFRNIPFVQQVQCQWWCKYKLNTRNSDS